MMLSANELLVVVVRYNRGSIRSNSPLQHLHELSNISRRFVLFLLSLVASGVPRRGAIAV